MSKNELEPDHAWAQRHAVAVAEAAISSGYTNLAFYFKVPKAKGVSNVTHF
jgi:hypothetical protein